jgi:tetratricopeptide (TPR) repeat protein
MPIRRKRRKPETGDEFGGVSIGDSRVNVGRDIVGRDSVHVDRQHIFQFGSAGLAAIVAVVGLVAVTIVAVVVWRAPDASSAPALTPVPTSAPVAVAPTMVPQPTVVPPTAPPDPTRPPPPTATTIPTSVPTATAVPTPKPIPMRGRFINIAVAPIGKLDAQGKVLPWPESGRFMPSIYERLQTELKPLVDAGEVAIRHEGVALVEGGSEAARDKFAASVRAEHQADLLIFANLQTEGGRNVLVPGFNVGKMTFDDRRSRLDDAEEILGTSRMRLPLKNPDPVTAPEQLAGRANALVYFALALTYVRAGENVYIDPSPFHTPERIAQRDRGLKLYATAVELFDKAEAALDDQDNGREVIHLFRGSMFKRFDGFNFSERAEEEFEKARQVNPEYARAYLGLGYNRLHLFLRQYEESDSGKGVKGANPENLKLAEAHIRSAMTAKDRPAEALVDVKIQVALGTVLLVAAQDVDPARYAEAETAFRSVVQQFEAGKPELEYLSSFAYFGLAVIKELRDSDLPAAHDLYQRVMDLENSASEVIFSAIDGRSRIKDARPGASPYYPYERPARIVPRTPERGMG